MTSSTSKRKITLQEPEKTTIETDDLTNVKQLSGDKGKQPSKKKTSAAANCSGSSERRVGSKISKKTMVCIEGCRQGKNSGCSLKSKGRGSSKDNFSCVEVHDLLRKMGLDEPEKCSLCVKSAIQKKIIEVKGDPSDLNMVVAVGTCEQSCDECSHQLQATLADLLKQPDYAGCDYEDGLQNATVRCKETGCPGRAYVTEICIGKNNFDSGKFHNHCSECPGFGQCIHDYRNTHCFECGKHYFGGSLGSFNCGCNKRGGKNNCTPM